jgi:hypothetical protein
MSNLRSRESRATSGGGGAAWVFAWPRLDLALDRPVVRFAGLDFLLWALLRVALLRLLFFAVELVDFFRAMNRL